MVTDSRPEVKTEVVVLCYECGRELLFERADWLALDCGDQGGGYHLFPFCPEEHRSDDDPSEGDARQYSR